MLIGESIRLANRLHYIGACKLTGYDCDELVETICNDIKNLRDEARCEWITCVIDKIFPSGTSTTSVGAMNVVQSILKFLAYSPGMGLPPKEVVRLAVSYAIMSFAIENNYIATSCDRSELEG